MKITYISKVRPGLNPLHGEACRIYPATNAIAVVITCYPGAP